MNSITAQSVTKRFNLGSQRPAYRNLSDWFSRETKPRKSARAESFLALDRVSFAMQPGEAVGIIGQNGAGKSTLLKVLSRILRPTSGRVELRGRIGSLLEVGTGFHPELNGYENIFLSASILGMRRKEIVRRLDEIVAFANIGEYLDQPVRYYSSGMYMRLAFAVAAHIEPEILLLDEVLAVGDAEFQKKCLSRIAQVRQNGQTVVFVSHNIPAVLRLCSRALLLERGRLVEDGSALDVTALYLRMRQPAAERRFPETLHAPGSRDAKLRAVRIRSRLGETLKLADIGSEFGIEMEFVVLRGGLVLFPALILNNEYGELLWSTDVSTKYHATPRSPGLYRVVAWIPAHLLAPGPLTVTAAMYSGWPYLEHFVEPNVISFEAIETGGGSRGLFQGYFGGLVRPWLEWSVEYDSSVSVDQKLTLGSGLNSER